MSENTSSYGTLPPSTPPPPTTTTIHSARKPPRPPPPRPPHPQHPPSSTLTRSQISTRRPWRVFFDYSLISLPYSYSESISRVRRNLNYFRVNYAMVTLLIIFLSLVYHPISMIVFLVISIGWFYYFTVQEPIVILGAKLDDRIVMIGLGLVTVTVLAFTHVGVNVLVALIVGFLILGLHGAFRGTEDLFFDENEAAESGLISVVS